MQALKEPNVHAHFTALSAVRGQTVIGADGGEIHDIDAIVLATGFDTTYKPRFDIFGKNNITLKEKFTPNPDSYLGIGVPGKSALMDSVRRSADDLFLARLSELHT